MHEDIYKLVSEKLNIPLEVVKSAYTAQWKFIKAKLRELSINDIPDKEDFSKYRTSFTIPLIGKIYIPWDRIEFFRKIKELNNLEDEKNTR